MAIANTKWSYSSLKQYVNCPQNYYRTRVTQEFKPRDTSYTLYGKAIHTAIENYIKHDTPIPKPYTDVLRLIPDILALLPNDQRVETPMAVTKDKAPCAFDAPDYWVRGIADLLGLEGDTATVIDWKTGSSKYADTKQLKLMGLLVFAHHPQIQRVKGMLYFTKGNEPVIAPDMLREDADKHWSSFNSDLSNLHMSFKNDNWPMKPSGLCGFCPVESCVHHRS